MSTSALSPSTSASSALRDSQSMRRQLTQERAKTSDPNSSAAPSSQNATTVASPHSGALNTKSLSPSSAQSMGQSASSVSTKEVLAARQVTQEQSSATRVNSGEKAYQQAIKAAQLPTSSSQPKAGSSMGPSVKAEKANAPSTNAKYNAGDAKKAPAQEQLYQPAQRAGNKALTIKSLGTGAM